MNTAVQDHLRAGELDQAIALMNAEVRQHPADIDRRGVLAELLCISGNLERADAILDSISTLDPKAAVGVALFRQIVRAEQARQQFLQEGRLPEFIRRPAGAMELELRAAIALREGAEAEAAALLAEAETVRPQVAGVAGANRFDDLRDLDDLSAAHLEVLTATGKYYWIPLAEVKSLEFRKPERRRDFIWRRASLSVADGPEGEIYIPSVYPSGKDGVAAHFRLGYETDFVGKENGPKFGVGLRTFLIGDNAVTILELNKLEFEVQPGGAKSRSQ
jgi:type VI secretion system protein ImpE